MPELPEVETTLRGIAPHVEQQIIADVIVRQYQLRWQVPPTIRQILLGKKIAQVERRGKYLLLKTQNGAIMIHLGMSGNLRILTNVSPPNKHDHIDITFSNKKIMRFCDPRRFGAFLWVKGNPHEHSLIIIGVATHKNWKLPENLRNVYGFLIPRRERRLIAAISIESNKNRNSVKEGELLNVMLDSKHAAMLLNKSDDEILKNIIPELEVYFPKLSGFINFSHCIRWPEAEPLSLVGRSKYIKRYKETLSPNASIVLAGDYLGFPYTDSAAFTGEWAANFIKGAGR